MLQNSVPLNSRRTEFADIYSIADRDGVPLSVTLELNTTCNLRCEHCYIPEWTNPGLSFAELDIIFTQLRRLGTFELVLTGGEVFSRPDLLKILRRARQLGFEVILFTNGTKITPPVAEQLASLYLGLVSVTVFSLDELVHDGITKRNGSLKKTLAAIESLRALDVPVQVKSIAMPKNYRDLPQLRNYCQAIGAYFLSTPYIFPQADRNKEPESFRLEGEELRDAVEFYDQVVEFQPAVRSPTDLMCPPLLHSFGIAANGDMSPCSTMFMPIGNVLQTPIEELWNSSAMKTLQQMTLADVTGCQDCVISSLCVRCAGNALLETGSLRNSSPMACSVARSRFANRQPLK